MGDHLVDGNYVNLPVCYTGDMLVNTVNITTGAVEAIPAREVITGVHKVIDAFSKDCTMPVKCNVVTLSKQRLHVVPEDTFGKNQPSQDLYVSSESQIMVGDKTIFVSDIPQTYRYSANESTELYSICTDISICILVAGVPVVTWDHNKMTKFLSKSGHIYKTQ